ncbi:MAG: TdeIII family type II restriction endonuclease [Treponema sp.]|jgi:type II restriction enzyme|nr:TdeIII family type II restriction endonuclease [Treponema sp.]
MLSDSQKNYIQSVIIDSLRQKFQNYSPESSNMPFHYRLLGKDRMALFSFIQSLNTTFGTSIFEPAAVALAKNNFAKVERQYIVGSNIYSNCQHKIQEIINSLTINPKPDKKQEINLLKTTLNGSINTLKPAKVDLFVETSTGEQFLFDLKTVKPNKSDFQKYKQTLLEWAGIALTANKNVKIHTLISIPYNPYEPKPYERWTMAGMLDTEQELMVAEEFWDFLGGKGAYIDLLDCFENAGIKLRPEIDNYFSKFNKDK